MKTAVRNAIVLVGGGGAVAALAIWGLATRHTPSIVDVLPKNAGLVLDVDLVAMRNTSRGRAILGGAAIGKALDARGACAKGILDKVEHLGLAVDGAGESSDDVALIASGKTITANEVIACARSTIEARGGNVVAQKDGSFSLVQDGDGAKGVLAVRDGGPIVIGRGAWLEGVLDAADGETKTLRDDPAHDLARREAKGAIATITYGVPPAIRADLAAKLPKGADSIAAVTSAIAAVRVDDAGALVVTIDAKCPREACGDLAKWLDGARTLVAADPLTTVLHVKNALEAATITATETDVRVEAKLAGDELDRAWNALENPGATSVELPAGHPATSPSGSTAAPPSTSASASASTP